MLWKLARVETSVSPGSVFFFTVLSIKQVNTVKRRKGKKWDQQLSPCFSTSLLVLRLKTGVKQRKAGYTYCTFFFSKHHIDHHIHLQSFQAHAEAELSHVWLR